MARLVARCADIERRIRRDDVVRLYRTDAARLDVDRRHRGRCGGCAVSACPMFCVRSTHRGWLVSRGSRVYRCYAPRLRVALLLIGAASVLFLVTRGERLVERSVGRDFAAGARCGRARCASAQRASGSAICALCSRWSVPRRRSDRGRRSAAHRLRLAEGHAARSRLRLARSLVPSAATQRSAARRAARCSDAARRVSQLSSAGRQRAAHEAFEPFIADVQRARELVIGPTTMRARRWASGLRRSWSSAGRTVRTRWR